MLSVVSMRSYNFFSFHKYSYAIYAVAAIFLRWIKTQMLQINGQVGLFDGIIGFFFFF